MRILVAVLGLLISSWSIAQTAGDIRDIDGQQFAFKDGIWTHSALAKGDQVEPAYRAVYKDDKWLKWYNAGGSTLKKILDLGENVIFKFQGSDGKFHAYQVSGTSQAVSAASDATVLGMSPKTAKIVGAAVIVGAIIIDDQNSGS